MKYTAILAMLVLFASATFLFAQEAATAPAKVTFESPAANNAVKDAEAAEAKAKAEYDKATIAAKTKLIEALSPLMEKATRSGDLDEAVKLRDKINELKAEIEAAKSPSPLVGDWHVSCPGRNYEGTMRVAADGTCSVLGNPANGLGRWVAEPGRLVIQWPVTKHVDTYTSGTAAKMTGTTEDGKALTATRVEKQP